MASLHRRRAQWDRCTGGALNGSQALAAHLMGSQALAPK